MLLAGQRIVGLDRRGKQLAVCGHREAVLVIHLGMTGRLFVRADSHDTECRVTRRSSGRRVPALASEGWSTEGRSTIRHSENSVTDDLNVESRRTDHIHCTWRLRGPGGRSGTLIFRDPRRFGGLWCLPSHERLLSTRWAALGPDALTIMPQALASRLKHSRRAIKAALLDQQVIAGVGNIYADEALHRAQVHPRRPAALLRPTDWESLARAIRTVMHEALCSGGSTLRDFVDAEGRPGTFVASHRVYGRGGQPCLACGRVLRSTVVAQRTTVYCPHCQAAARGTRPGRTV